MCRECGGLWFEKMK
ncbi:hypothetical protein [Pseudoalteromonas prydzensis]